MKRIIHSFLLVFCSLFFTTFAQTIAPNKYGLAVVSSYDDYKALITKDSSQTLVDLEKFIPGIKLDIRYATSNNFFGEPVYNIKKAFARLPAAAALKEVQEELKKKNLGLLIFDGYRPYSVTVRFFEKLRDTVFLAVPWRGSRHNRGCAIDLSIVSLETGKELEMPTPFDDFTPKANAYYKDLPEIQIANRELLKEIMTRHGFAVYSDEWWHYDFLDWKKFNLTDISFEELSK